MTPPELAKTIYLGDRGCKSVLLDGWHDRIVVQVTRISRIRSPSGEWRFYNEEDIEEGLLVLTGVLAFKLTPSDAIPNDMINYLKVDSSVGGTSAPRDPAWRFVLSVGSTDQSGRTREVVMEIVAADLHLEDPRDPGRKIQT